VADETSAVFRELIDEVRGLERKLYEGPNTPLDDQGVIEGYKWIFSILQVALEVNMWADAARPRFVDIVGPHMKWGGDNADAFYSYAPIDPARTYHVRGRTGDTVYFSLTVYGGPNDGRYSNRIVGTVNDRTLDIAPDGTFELVLSSAPHDGNWLKLDPDAVCAITRDYLIDPVNGRRMEWRIDAHGPPPSKRETDAGMARGLRAALTWIREQAGMVPLPLGEPNTIEPPYPVPQVTYGWQAGDAAYAFGSFALEADEMLVIEGTSPACAFWNVCLWNQFLHTYNYDYERVTINGGQIAYEHDGSWRIVVSHADPGEPNWVSTAGHPRGRIWFRWFHPEATPEQPKTRVERIGR
jgi:hypothetical protein